MRARNVFNSYVLQLLLLFFGVLKSDQHVLKGQCQHPIVCCANFTFKDNWKIAVNWLLSRKCWEKKNLLRKCDL